MILFAMHKKGLGDRQMTGAVSCARCATLKLSPARFKSFWRREDFEYEHKRL